MMAKKIIKLGLIRYEIILMISIIVCISYIVIYENNIRLNTAISVSPKGNIAVLHEEYAINSFEELGWPIIYFNHDSTQFLTLYDENQEEIYQLMLGDVLPLHDKIDSLRDWWPVFNSTDDGGQIDLTSEGIEILINYQWLHYDNGTKYLLVYNTSIFHDHMFTTFHIVCYTAIILSFIMLIYLICWSYHSLVNTYKKLNDQVQEIISK